MYFYLLYSIFHMTLFVVPMEALTVRLRLVVDNLYVLQMINFHFGNCTLTLIAALA